MSTNKSLINKLLLILCLLNLNFIKSYDIDFDIEDGRVKALAACICATIAGIYSNSGEKAFTSLMGGTIGSAGGIGLLHFMNYLTNASWINHTVQNKIENLIWSNSFAILLLGAGSYSGSYYSAQSLIRKHKDKSRKTRKKSN